MMLSDVCRSDVWRLSRTSGRRAACAAGRPAGRLDGAYWLIGPGSAGLAQGCCCGLPLQAWAGAYRGGRPPAYSLLLPYSYLFVFSSSSGCNYNSTSIRLRFRFDFHLTAFDCSPKVI